MSQPFGSMPDSNNPFSPPQNSQYEAPQRPASKPTMATAFGILNLVFGGLALLQQGISLIMLLFLREKFQELTKQTVPQPSGLHWVAVGITLLLTAWLIYSGVRVLGGTLSGRSAFIGYCVGSLTIRPFVVALSLYVQFDQMKQQLAQIQGGGPPMPPEIFMVSIVVGGIIALVMAEVYEAVGFFVMRSKSVTQQFQAWDSVVNGQSSNPTFGFNSP